MKQSLWKIRIILTFLNCLQGLFFGLLLETLQIQLKTDFSYSEVGVFLLCGYPLSLKLLWSPFVDTYYFPKLGRRKSWIMISQLISVIILFFMSLHIDTFLIEKRIYVITALSLSLIFLISIQDIAVEGLAFNLCGKEVKL